MSEQEKRCPLCGKETTGDEVFCRDCQEIAHNSYSEELLANESSQETEDNPSLLIEEPAEPENTEVEEIQQITPVVKSNKKGIVFIMVGLILMLLVGGIGSYVFLQNKNAEETEIRYWNQCIDENTPLGYSKYLVQYPEGKFSDEAQKKIVELRNTERKTWDKLRKSNDIDALFSFVKDHPDTPYMNEIRHAIDSLSWLRTLKNNTADGYLAYIENVNIGRYTGEYKEQAQEKYDYLSQLKTVEGENLAEVKKVIDAFFKSLSNTNEKELSKVTASSLVRFYKAGNQSPETIIDSLKQDYKKNKVRNVLYTPVSGSVEAIVDNKGVYFITLPVKIEKSYTDKKKKKENSEHSLYLEMNDKKQVQTVYRKQF